MLKEMRAEPSAKQRDVSKLPDEMRAKFSELESALDFKNKVGLLNWFVHSMRPEALNYLEKENIIQNMQPSDKT